MGRRQLPDRGFEVCNPVASGVAQTSVAQTFLSAVSQVFQPAGQQKAGPFRGFVAAADRNVGDTADKNVGATLGNAPSAGGCSFTGGFCSTFNPCSGILDCLLA
jgi:hypothetical protein